MLISLFVDLSIGWLFHEVTFAIVCNLAIQIVVNRWPFSGLPTPTGGIILDFQLSRYAPPALDVFTVIMLSTTSEFRTLHMESLLNVYYDALTEHVAAQGLALAQLLPRSEFDASCDHYHLAGLIENCLFCHLILIPMNLAKPMMATSESFDDFIRNGSTKVQLCIDSYEQDETFRTRLTDMLSELIEKYILWF